jgi:hypothetical protein
VPRFTRTKQALLSMVLALRAPSPLACGICVEDQIAATYDHEVLARAEAAGRDVMYAAVHGKNAGAPRSDALIRQAIGAVSAVDRNSIRLSLLPPAASFAWDSKRHGSGAVLRAVNDRLAGSGLTLVALRNSSPKGDTRR